MTIDAEKDEADLLERAAHRWVSLLVSGEATEADAAALKSWCRQSPAHEAAFAAATRRWRDFGPAGRELLAEGLAPAWSPPRIGRRAMLGGAAALAAAVAGYAVVKPPLGLWPSLGELTADYRTATGEQRVLTLAGDVAVRMNTQTSLALASGADRSDQVRLIAGEASFATGERSARPLTVLAGDGRTVAMRARFEVRAGDGGICVTCLDGEVRVEQRAQTALVAAGWQLRYGSGGLGRSVRIDPVEAAAWQEGVLIFRATPLSAAVAEINRYRPGRVIVLDAALAARPISGRVRIDRIGEALAWIEQAVGAQARALPGGIVVLS